MEKFFMEGQNVKQMNVPSDMDTPITGARIKMDKGDRLAIVLSMGDSTLAAVVEFLLKQHNAASGGTSKALAVMNPYFYKAGASTSFTKVEPTAVEDDYDLSATFATQEGVVVFEVLSEDLDVEGGFAWVSVDAADSTAAKILAGLYVVGKGRFLPAYDQAV